jgi:hypothetical protein
MANDRNRTDEQFMGPSRDREREPVDERVRDGGGEDIRGVADEEDENLEDMEDLEDEDDGDGSF